VEPESDKGEEDDWEAQQIRKGVTGAQVSYLFIKRNSLIPAKTNR